VISAAVQRHNPFNGELIGHDAFFARQFLPPLLGLRLRLSPNPPA